MISLRTVPRVRGPATDRLPLALPLTVIAGGQARTGVSIGILTLGRGPASVASSTTETEPPLPPKQPRSLHPKTDHSLCPQNRPLVAPQIRPLCAPQTDQPLPPKQTTVYPQNRAACVPQTDQPLSTKQNKLCPRTEQSLLLLKLASASQADMSLPLM